ncbi:MAG: hypothetical protein ACLFVK_07780 [Dehalococcoidia bacterium]
MRILTGKQIRDFEEAARVAYREAGASDMSLSVAQLLAPLVDTGRLHSEAERNIGSTIRGKYGKNATWSGKPWYIPVPRVGYDTREIPHILIEVTMYLAANEKVRVRDASYQVTLVGTIGKSQTLVLPVIFLRAMLDDDLQRFAVLARGGNWTTWEIPGTRPLQLPDEMVTRLSSTLRRQSVGTWLRSFGTQGRSVAPLAVGALLGLQSMGRERTRPVNSEHWTYEGLVSALESMAYTTNEAREVVKCATPYLRADHSVEEAIRIVMRIINEGR